MKTRAQNAEKVQGEYLTEPEMQRRERENLLVVLRKTGWKIKGVGLSEFRMAGVLWKAPQSSFRGIRIVQSITT